MVLDLGCGEGLLPGEYLRRHPAARVTLLDGSAEMLALASRRGVVPELGVLAQGQQLKG